MHQIGKQILESHSEKHGAHAEKIIDGYQKLQGNELIRVTAVLFIGNPVTGQKLMG